MTKKSWEKADKEMYWRKCSGYVKNNEDGGSKTSGWALRSTYDGMVVLYNEFYDEFGKIGFCPPFPDDAKDTREDAGFKKEVTNTQASVKKVQSKSIEPKTKKKQINIVDMLPQSQSKVQAKQQFKKETAPKKSQDPNPLLDNLLNLNATQQYYYDF